MSVRSLVGSLGVVVMVGCGVAEPPPDASSVASARQSAVVENGTNLNGTNLNGTNLNGSELASTLVSVSLDGVTRSGAALDDVRLEGAIFVGRIGSTWHFGRDFIGAEFTGHLGDGSAVALRIADVSADGWPNLDVWRYSVQYLDRDQTWKPICANGATAVPVSGRWNYDFGSAEGGARIDDARGFTWGCAGGAVEKCVSIGYRPWRTYGTRSGTDLHQTCVRLIRADFCGNGVSHTTNGRRINLYDGVGVQRDTEYWLLEAEWDTAGARCISPLNRSLVGLLCADRLVDLGCGAKSRFEAGTLLMSETPAGPLPL